MATSDVALEDRLGLEKGSFNLKIHQKPLPVCGPLQPLSELRLTTGNWLL